MSDGRKFDFVGFKMNVKTGPAIRAFRGHRHFAGADQIGAVTAVFATTPHTAPEVGMGFQIERVLQMDHHMPREGFCLQTVGYPEMPPGNDILVVVDTPRPKGQRFSGYAHPNGSR